VWLDTRTLKTCHQLIEQEGDKFKLQPICGLPIATYFSAMKVKWLMDHVPAVAEACKNGDCAFGTIDSWLIWVCLNLFLVYCELELNKNTTRKRITFNRCDQCITNNVDEPQDFTMGERNLRVCLLVIVFISLFSKLNIPVTILPEIKSSSEIYGEVSSGFLQGIPISGVFCSSFHSHPN
jgi:glycerol kinase